MATVTKGGVLPDTGVTKNEVYALVDSATISAVVNADVDTNAAIVDTKLATISTAGKVSGAALTLLTSIPSGAGVIPIANIPTKIVQVVNTQTGAVATGTTAVPADDTIPQITEGIEFMTLAITPTSATNKLKIEVVFIGSHSVAANWVTVALFQDTTTNALAATSFVVTATGDVHTAIFTHYMTTGTTSATTFRVRAGGETASTTTFNGSVGAREGGGVYASSITITEIKV